MTDHRKEMRTPITLKIKFKSASLGQFIERYSVDVSRGGIFIRTKEPLAIGTQLRFEFQLQDTSSLIAGDGTVVWLREADPIAYIAHTSLQAQLARHGGVNVGAPAELLAPVMRHHTDVVIVRRRHVIPIDVGAALEAEVVSAVPPVGENRASPTVDLVLVEIELDDLTRCWDASEQLAGTALGVGQPVGALARCDHCVMFMGVKI